MLAEPSASPAAPTIPLALLLTDATPAAAPAPIAKEIPTPRHRGGSYSRPRATSTAKAAPTPATDPLPAAAANGRNKRVAETGDRCRTVTRCRSR